jgi:hypothetical protein
MRVIRLAELGGYGCGGLHLNSFDAGFVLDDVSDGGEPVHECVEALIEGTLNHGQFVPTQAKATRLLARAVTRRTNHA